MTIPNASSCTRLLTPSFSLYRFVVFRTLGAEYICPLSSRTARLRLTTERQAGPSCDGVRPGVAWPGMLRLFPKSRGSRCLKPRPGFTEVLRLPVWLGIQDMMELAFQVPGPGAADRLHSPRSGQRGAGLGRKIIHFAARALPAWQAGPQKLL